MIARISLITLLLAFCQVASAEQSLKLTAHSYELEANQFSLPEKAGRSVFIQPCNNCPGKRHTMAKETSFWVGEESVSMEEMRLAIQENPKGLLVVSYLIENGNLASLRLIRREPSSEDKSRDNRPQRYPRGNNSHGASN